MRSGRGLSCVEPRSPLFHEMTAQVSLGNETIAPESRDCHHRRRNEKEGTLGFDYACLGDKSPTMGTRRPEAIVSILKMLKADARSPFSESSLIKRK